MDLENLVDEWMTVPDLADALGTTASRARGVVSDRRVLGVRRGERATFQIPAKFVVSRREEQIASGKGAPVDAADDRRVVLSSLAGTITVLGDRGYSDEEILSWLFSEQEPLGCAPIDALRAGRTTEVRRIAQVAD
ncbi:hypothetical protein SAMN04489860_1569 [Paraoerskovia marina]|uniref:Rv2175c C-terminal domain-containing protein n=1 Tax=Paraoerskovia marina TaxID=545619 RepID=A0A1H1SA79_9CELL|nr:Rv2175c family DNA-binding protein [Paraoerskovia marina]SDS44708.1 hypothetical protein SAMN04489860_1569 [Paraoerskovia marina]